MFYGSAEFIFVTFEIVLVKVGRPLIHHALIAAVHSHAALICIPVNARSELEHKPDIIWVEDLVLNGGVPQLWGVRLISIVMPLRSTDFLKVASVL